MNRKNGSGSGIFLMEMMVVVLFFMLCASTCILAFVKADRMSRLADEQNQAVSAAQSVAEIWKAEGTAGLEQRMKAHQIEPGSVGRAGTPVPEGLYRVTWDGDWQCLGWRGPEEKELLAGRRMWYTAWILETQGEDGLSRLSVSVQEREYPDEEQLFHLEAVRRLSDGGS